MKQYLQTAIAAALASGKAVLRIYEQQDVDIVYKEDQSPVTQADILAHDIIKKHLSQSQIPIISEEQTAQSYIVRKSWKQCWMIDPIDGTKEFINKTNDFTINIALIENNFPTLGVIYLPAFDILYFALKNKGAYKLENASTFTFSDILTHSQSLPFKKTEDYTILISRSHADKKTKKFIDTLKTSHKNLQILSRGSSLKFCLLAEGNANIYPRLIPLKEWDIAAGVAIAQISGVKIYNAKTNNPLTFNTENLIAEPFIAKWD